MMNFLQAHGVWLALGGSLVLGIGATGGGVYAAAATAPMAAAVGGTAETSTSSPAAPAVAASDLASASPAERSFSLAGFRLSLPGSSEQPTAVPTEAPSATPSASEAAPAAPDAPLAQTPPNALLGPLENIVQTVNNCGPASVAEVLHFWGIDRSQNELQSILRPDDPYGMTTANLPGYIQSLGLKLMIGTSGSQPLMKALIANGFPLIANQMVSVTDGTFHYRAIDGYDDSKGAFISSDPLLGPDYPIPYDQFDTVWLATGRTFIVIYPPAQDAVLQSVLAANSWSPGAYAVGAAVDHSAPVTTASVRGTANPNGSYAGTVTVSLSAIDVGAGVAQTTFRIDGGVAQNYGRPFTVSGGGRHTVSFRSADYAGNLEAEQSLGIVIAGAGGAPPSTSWSVNGSLQPDGSYAAGAQLILTAHDSGTGVQGVQFALNGANPQAYGGPIALSSGSDTITYQATDLAGDVEPLRSVTVEVADAPASAAAVVSSPTPTRTPTRTNTPVPPTSTPTLAPTVAASATTAPTQAPSATAVPPTATRVPATATSVPSTATPVNTATRPASPTSPPTIAPTATAPRPTATPH